MTLQLTELKVQRFSHGAGFTADGIRASDAVLDPFLMVDHYRMSQPTFGAHPHAGFSAVTYMFDDADTGFINRDSLGPASEIHPGDAHWSIAGKGIVHDEVPREVGKTAHGLQLFVNLPSDTELQPARSVHLAREAMPRFTSKLGAQIKLAFGRFNDAELAHQFGQLPSDVSLFDIHLPSGAQFNYALGEQTGILIPIEGQPQAARSAVGKHELRFSAFAQPETLVSAPIAIQGQDPFSIATTHTAHFVLLTGTQIREPVFRQGPFALSSAERLRDAITRYQQGEFGELL